MSTSKYVPIRQLPEALRVYMSELIPLLGLEVAKEVARQLWMEIGKASPIGHPERDDHPGKYQASHTIGLGSPKYKQLPDLASYPRLSAPEADEALAPATPGLSIYIGNAAADDGREEDSYAASLEAGVRTKDGRSYGSSQAPEGIYKPSIEVVYSRRATIVSTAIRHTEEQL